MMRRVRTDRPRKSKAPRSLPVAPSGGLDGSPWPYTEDQLQKIARQLGLPLGHNTVRFVVGIARDCINEYKAEPADRGLNLHHQKSAKAALKASKALETLHTLFENHRDLANTLMNTGVSIKDGIFDLGKDPEGDLAGIRLAQWLKEGHAHIAGKKLIDYAKNENSRIAPATAENFPLNSAVVKLLVVWHQQHPESNAGLTGFFRTALGPLNMLHSLEKGYIDSLRRRAGKYIR